jgi:hypothetical protein
MHEVLRSMKGRSHRADAPKSRNAGAHVNVEGNEDANFSLCVVDNAPIREAALRAYATVKRELEELEQRLLNFREKEVPAFRMWLHRELGPTMSRLRELEERHAEESALHAEILRERDRNGGSYHAAWLRVKARRDAGIPEPNDFIHRAWQNQQARRAATTAGAETGEKDAALINGAREVGEWENLSDSEFEKMAEAFQAVALAMARSEGDESYIASAREVVERERKRREGKGRLKDLYRKLARLLHPDSNAALSENQRRLWQEVQEAYRQGNVTQLEFLLHRVDADGDILPGTASVALIREVTEQTRAVLSEMRLQLLFSQDDPAWGFLAKKGRSLTALKKKMQKSLESIAEGMRGAIHELRLTLRRWTSAEERGGSQRETGAGRIAKSRPQKHPADGQTEFRF